MHRESCVVVAAGEKPQPLAETGRQLAETGMQRTLEAEREEWIVRALESLLRFSREPGWHEFKAEDWRHWWLAHGGTEPHDHHVYGALTNRACRAGIIEWTGRFAVSVSPKTHGHPVKVWRACFSLVPNVAGAGLASVKHERGGVLSR